MKAISKADIKFVQVLLLCVIFLLIGIMLLIISFKQKKDAVYNNNTPINVVCHIEHLDVFERIANELEDLNFKIKAFKEDRPFEAHRKLSMKKETKDANKEKTKSK